MDKLLTRLRRIGRGESGQDMVEYVLIMALVSIVAVGAVEATGTDIGAFWQTISSAVAAAP